MVACHHEGWHCCCGTMSRGASQEGLAGTCLSPLASLTLSHLPAALPSSTLLTKMPSPCSEPPRTLKPSLPSTLFSTVMALMMSLSLLLAVGTGDGMCHPGWVQATRGGGCLSCWGCPQSQDNSPSPQTRGTQASGSSWPCRWAGGWEGTPRTFDGGVDEDDAAHGGSGTADPGGPIEQAALLAEEAAGSQAGLAAGAPRPAARRHPRQRRVPALGHGGAGHPGVPASGSGLAVSSRGWGCPPAGEGHGIVQQHMPGLGHRSLLAGRCWGRLAWVLGAGRMGPGRSVTAWGDKELCDPPSPALSPPCPTGPWGTNCCRAPGYHRGGGGHSLPCPGARY